MEMREQYGLPDLRQYMTGRTHFQGIPQGTEPFLVHRNLTQTQHYESIMVGGHTGEVLRPRGLVDFGMDNTTTVISTSVANSASVSASASGSASSAGVVCGFDVEGGCVGGEGGNSRWPRQETLTLLEIRSRLDSKFKEANQKGPLWDEVSRIMAEEHGYQRSGKKCREKFENLYKYYKKTKEAKAGRQDGKHYRFFRQLEALYGETSNPTSVLETTFVGNNFPCHATNSKINQANQEALQDQKLCESLSFTNSSEFETSSSENNDEDLSAIAFMMNHSMEKKKKMNESQCVKRARKSWKAKIKDFVDSHMKKLIETQEAWMEKMLKTIEHKEQERLSREEEWRKQEAARFDQEFKFWANERAWIEARDATLFDALKKLTGKELTVSLPEELMNKKIQDHNKNNMEDCNSEIPTRAFNINRWPESEISSLIQLRTSMEPRFQESGHVKEGLWEEISVKMACLGYDRSALSCKEKWENISIYFNRTMDYNKKCKEHLRTNTYFQQLGSYHGQEQIAGQGPDQTLGLQTMNDNLSPSNSNAGTAMHDGCFRILMDEGENSWENYGFKYSKGKNQQL